MNDAKLNSYISKWDTVEPYKCNDAGPSEGGKSSVDIVGPSKWDMVTPGNANMSTTASEGSPDGDNPSMHFSADLPDQGDQRNKTGGSNSAPAPGKTGAGI